VAAEVTVPLVDGIKLGGEQVMSVTLRELRAGDMIDAQFEAERLVDTRSGPQLVASPAAMGLALLRRQIARLGAINGPATLEDLRKLSGCDMALIQAEAERLDGAVGRALGAAVADRGRDEGVGAPA